MYVVCKNSMCVHVCAFVDVCVCAFVYVCVFINTYIPPANSLTKRTGVGGGGYPVRGEDTEI